MMKRMLSMMVVACLLTLAVGVFESSAKKYTATVGWPPTHIITKNGFTGFVKDLKAASNGSIDFELYAGGSLLATKETMKGVADNVAQVGMITGAYVPADVPLNNVLNDAAFVAKDPLAAACAMTEITLTNSALYKEFEKNGVVFGGGYSTPVYHFATTSEIKTVADMKGKKIRTAGGAQVDWVNSLGGVSVSMSSTDIYSGMERGSLQGCMVDLTALTVGFRLIEVTKSVNLIPLGTHISGATWIYNKNFWKELTPTQRRLMFDQMALAFVRMQLDYEKTVNEALNECKAKKISILEPDATMKAALEKFNSALIKNLPENAVKQRRVTDPTSIIQQFLKLMDKWEGIIAKIDRTNEAAVLNVVKKEIYDRIDEKSYGVK